MEPQPDRDAEALRRRLYGPRATQDDLDRYLAAAPPPPADPTAEAAPVRRPRRRGPIMLAAALAVAALAVLVPALQQGSPAPAGSPSPSVVVLPTDLPDVVYADAGTVLSYRGQGSRTVPLETSVAPADGSMTVLVEPADPARAATSGSLTWEVQRSPAASRGTADRIRLRPDRGTAQDDVPLLLDYTGTPPDRVAVTAPDSAHWTLVVTFLRGRSPA